MTLKHITMVRAFDGQPLKRVVVDIGPDVFDVANPRYLDEVIAGRCGPIGFRRIDCFAWDDAVFETLARAYAASGHTDPRAWSTLTPFAGQPIDHPS